MRTVEMTPFFSSVLTFSRKFERAFDPILVCLALIAPSRSPLPQHGPRVPFLVQVNDCLQLHLLPDQMPLPPHNGSGKQPGKERRAVTWLQASLVKHCQANAYETEQAQNQEKPVHLRHL
jgi:hypothetical protein